MLVKHCFGLFHIVSQMVIINCLQQWLSDSANTQQGFSKFSTDMTLYGLGQQWAGNKTVIKVHLTSCNASWPPSMAFGKAIWSLKALTQTMYSLLVTLINFTTSASTRDLELTRTFSLVNLTKPALQRLLFHEKSFEKPWAMKSKME